MTGARHAARYLARFAAALAAAAFGCALAAEPEAVEFPSLGRSEDGTPVMLTGYFFKPETTEPAAAVVLFHGCGGLLTASGRIGQRFTAMAELLNEMGYAVLLPDSFNPRGHRQICTTRPSQRTIKARHRTEDAYGALAWLREHEDVRGDKVGAIGFSHGATNVLTAIDASEPAYRQAGKGYTAAVALYPGCAATLRKSPEFSAYAPLLMLLGEADDWTPAAPCLELADRSEDRGEPVEAVVYPDAHHGFDGTGPVRLRTDVRHGPNGSAGVHSGGNPAAREDAYRRIREFFGMHLGLDAGN